MWEVTEPLSCSNSLGNKAGGGGGGRGVMYGGHNTSLFTILPLPLLSLSGELQLRDWHTVCK